MDIAEMAQKYIQLFGEEPAGADAIEEIESTLKIELPIDFKHISRFYGGGIVGGISHFAISANGSTDNIAAETKRLRKAIEFPLHLVFLAEPPESLIVLDCLHDASDAVIWCDASEVENLGRPERMNKPHQWKHYADFFEFLLAREEKERRRHA